MNGLVAGNIRARTARMELENVEFKRKIEAEVVELNYKCQASPKTFKALREALGKWTK